MRVDADFLQTGNQIGIAVVLEGVAGEADLVVLNNLAVLLGGCQNAVAYNTDIVDETGAFAENPVKNEPDEIDIVFLDVIPHIIGRHLYRKGLVFETDRFDRGEPSLVVHLGDIVLDDFKTAVPNRYRILFFHCKKLQKEWSNLTPLMLYKIG